MKIKQHILKNKKSHRKMKWVKEKIKREIKYLEKNENKNTTYQYFGI